MSQFPQPDAHTCFLYLVRHGATDNNLANPPRLQGSRSNPSLSAAGREQAEAVARFLAPLPAAALYASPLVRARETAEAIARPHGLPVHLVDAFIECDVGNWEGRDWGEIERSEPEAFRRFIEDPGVHPYHGGESIGAVVRRVGPAFEQLMAAHLGQSVIVAAHNVVNRGWIASLLRLPLNRARDIPQNNCGVNLLAYRGGRTRVISINMALHLQHE